MPSHLLPALAQSQKEADEAATAKEKEDEKKKKKVRREGGSYTDPAHYNGGRNAQKYLFAVLQLKFCCTCCVAGSVYKWS